MLWSFIFFLLSTENAYILLREPRNPSRRVLGRLYGFLRKYGINPRNFIRTSFRQCFSPALYYWASLVHKYLLFFIPLVEWLSIIATSRAFPAVPNVLTFLDVILSSKMESFHINFLFCIDNLECLCCGMFELWCCIIQFSKVQLS